MSLSTSRPQFCDELRELSDQAYFRRCILVAAAHNLPVQSYPWTFASVISVASHDEARPDDATTTTRLRRWISMPAGSGCRWPAGRREIRSTGNSFAAPHIAAHRALHPEQAPDAHAVPAQVCPL